MVNHTTIETLVGYTLEANQGYGESHNNRDMGYTLEANQGYGESHNNRDMGWLHSRSKLGLW